jgi:hypothetical protein
MKGNRIYLFGLLAFLLSVFVYQYFSPKEFVWNPTFSKYDKQPFGSFVFDDVMMTSVEGYGVENRTFYQLYGDGGDDGDDRDNRDVGDDGDDRDNRDNRDDRDVGDDGDVGEVEDSCDFTVLGSYGLPLEERRAFLITESEISFSGVDLKAMLSLLHQGHKIMLCLSSFPRILCDSIGFSFDDDGYYSIQTFARFAREGNLRDSLFFGSDSLRPEKVYAFYPHLHPIVLKEGRQKNYFGSEKDTTANKDKLRCDWSEIVVRNKDGKAVAMRLGIGEGELFLVATPLMFTNYGMLDGENASYTFRLLAYMKELPLTRIEAYGRFADQT